MWRHAAYAIRLFIAFCLIPAGVVEVRAGEKEPLRAAILISVEKKPYFEAMESINKVFNKESSIETEVFSVEKKKDQQLFDEKLVKGEFKLVIAIGLEAFRLMNTTQESKTPLIYTMVHPEKILKDSKPSCGILFSIPADIQLRHISRSLPDVRRLGLLYDPDENDAFFKESVEVAHNFNIRIIPLKVSSSKITPVLDDNWKSIDGLWMIPDQTVTPRGSQTVIHYIIKEAIKKKIPVIGYNRFFHETGAVLSFIFDNEEIGEQTARLALDILAKKNCSDLMPIFHVWLNHRVIEILGIRSLDKGIPPIEIK